MRFVWREPASRGALASRLWGSGSLLTGLRWFVDLCVGREVDAEACFGWRGRRKRVETWRLEGAAVG